MFWGFEGFFWVVFVGRRFMFFRFFGGGGVEFVKVICRLVVFGFD